MSNLLLVNGADDLLLVDGASLLLLAASEPMQQIVPVATLVSSGWTDQVGGTTDLFSVVDELTSNLLLVNSDSLLLVDDTSLLLLAASEPIDADYVKAVL